MHKDGMIKNPKVHFGITFVSKDDNLVRIVFFYYYFKISFKRYNASSLIKQKIDCNSIEAYYDKPLKITLLIGKESFLEYYISSQRSQISHQLVLKYQNSEMQVFVIQFLVLIGVIQSRVLFGVIRFLVLFGVIRSRVAEA
jgi:hypothetical protein